jgi:hypothetical protein
MSSKVRFASCLLSLASLGVAAADGRGLSVDPDRLAWPVLQARLHVGAEAIAPVLGNSEGATLRPRSAALFGDYYVSKPYFGGSGGVRLTSGVVVGPRGAVFGPGQATTPGAFAVGTVARALGSGVAEAGSDTLAWPYLGIGYSGSSLRGGWGFSADLGLAAQNVGVLRPAKALGSQPLDDTLREMRLMPVLQLGVSYRF